jgi:hypothetical protein
MVDRREVKSQITRKGKIASSTVKAWVCKGKTGRTNFIPTPAAASAPYYDCTSLTKTKPKPKPLVVINNIHPELSPRTTEIVANKSLRRANHSSFEDAPM